MIRMLVLLGYLIGALVVLLGAYCWYAVAFTRVPDMVTYGASFNVPYARELGLPWRDVYVAMLDDLKVKHLRIAAHWPIVEPERGARQWAELDEQVRLAESRGASVTLAVGRRLPRWPECHVPEWAKTLSWEEQKEAIRVYLTSVVTRYKDSGAVVRWQVENEPFLSVFAREHCGELDTAFLEEEVALVKSIDPSRPVLLTDSGNLGTWHGAYRRGDQFGTSVYVYLFNEVTGEVRTVLPPETYIIKRSIMQHLFGPKDTLLIELSLEPWFDRSLADVPVNEQVERMSPARFDEIIAYARSTRMEAQYLWGAEWWYWLKERGDDRYWEKARLIFGG